MKFAGALGAALLLTMPSALAASTAPAAPNKSPEASSPFPGGNSKEPISIEADKLVYFEKEQKAIYTGNVVVIQGDTKLTCSSMTIFMEKAPAAGAAAPAKPSPTPAAGAPSGQSNRIRHMDCAGPVTVLSKTQTATGDSAIYDKPQNKVWLIGHVTLSDGGNVTKGEKLTYDMVSGQATVDPGGAGSRVVGQFLPGGATSAPAAPAAAPPAKPKAP